MRQISQRGFIVLVVTDYEDGSTEYKLFSPKRTLLYFRLGERGNCLVRLFGP